MVTFYVPHRRVRALVVPQSDGSARMLVGAQVKLDIFGAKEFERLAGEIGERVDSAARDGTGPPVPDQVRREPEPATLVSD
jgi:hypothetical protein